MPLSARHRSRRAGVVLLVVLFFALLLTSSIATFIKRSLIDDMISRNRENAVRAEALARGGVRLAEALLIEDRALEASGAAPITDSLADVWASLRDVEIDVGSGATLRLAIEDSGSKLNLNALFGPDDQGELAPFDETPLFLEQLFEKVIDEMPIPPGEKLYDPAEMAENLMDWIDGDEERQGGGPEDDWYQRQTPPYDAANRPLLSVDELRLVEGFDGKIVEALRHYVTVYPFVAGGCGNGQVGCGVNLNTAPPHVLALLYYNDGVDLRLAKEDVVRDVLRIREEGRSVCPPGPSDESCTPIEEIVPNDIFPPPTFVSQIFVVTAEARVGEVRRTAHAVVDRSQASEPRLLSWRVR